MTLTLTLIQPASKWMHWATLRRHSCLSRAATSASSQVIVIFHIYFWTVPSQLALGRPGPFLKPGTSQYSACCGIRWWSIRRTWPSLLSLNMFSMLCCPVLVLTSAFVTLSFREIPNILLCNRWCASSSFFSYYYILWGNRWWWWWWWRWWSTINIVTLAAIYRPIVQLDCIK